MVRQSINKIIFLILMVLFFQDSASQDSRPIKYIRLDTKNQEKNQGTFENVKILKSQNQLILKLTGRVVNLLNVPDVRQSTLYTCGPASLLAVLSYYKRNEGLREMQIAKIAHTSQQDGTSPQNLQKTIQKLGLYAQVRENMSLQDLQTSILNKQPVIVAFQAWLDSQIDWENDWVDGHYAVIIGYDQDYIYFEDPSLIGSIGYIQKNEFLKRWHDIDGEQQKFFNFGIIVKSNQEEKQVIQKLE